MRLLPLFLLLSLVLTLSACGQSDEATDSEQQASPPPTPTSKGIGDIVSVELNSPLDPDLVAAGKAAYELKCTACHLLTDKRSFGPGWQGITTKRTPEWIMNMILNVEVMLKEDPTARALLDECLTRMPHQHIEPEEARAILEFMYANDGGIVGQPEDSSL